MPIFENLDELDGIFRKTHTQLSKTKSNLKSNSLLKNLPRETYRPRWLCCEFYKICQEETMPIFPPIFPEKRIGKITLQFIF